MYILSLLQEITVHNITKCKKKLNYMKALCLIFSFIFSYFLLKSFDFCK